MLAIVRLILGGVLAPVVFVLAYFAAALLGGLIPASLNKATDTADGDAVTIYLTGTLLHTDIAIPVTPEIRERYGFLGRAGFPINANGLRYLVIGWGSEAFYTATAAYSDIALATAWKAATGDRAVLHIGPAGDLSRSDDVTAVLLNKKSFGKMLNSIDRYFVRKADQPVLLRNKTFGFGDRFYKAEGHFNLLNPCNVWVSEIMKNAGMGSGLWTPTSYSLLLSQYLYN